MALSSRSRLLVFAGAAGLILATAVPAYAAWELVRYDSYHDESQEQRVWSYVKQDGKQFKCGGENYHPGTPRPWTPEKMLASYVCQYQQADGDWVDFPNLGTVSRQDSEWSGLDYTTANNPCSGSDGPPNLSGNNRKIRGQADGYMDISITQRAQFRGDAAMHTTSVTIDCS